MRRHTRFLILLIPSLLAIAAALLWYTGERASNSGPPIRTWFTNPSARPALVTAGGVACPGAPFILPSSGLVGLLWRDPLGPYTVFNRHTGIDIFGDGPSGTVPVYAAYEGHLTRMDNWVSSVIIRHDDPLQPGRTIWTYYTHMASRDGSRSYIVPEYPAGTYEQPVQQGDLLGYQGEYSPGLPIGLHLHFSIVLSDEEGSFRNEAVLENTLDPSPYLGLPLNINALPERPLRCAGQAG